MFSIFDPSSSYISINWLIIIYPFLFIKKRWKKNSTKISALTKYITIFIKKEINQLIEKKLKLTSLIFLTVFLLILTINVLAIFPHNFTPTAHISIRLSLRASIWMCTITFGWTSQFYKIIVHLTPVGTPNALINFIVIIETIRTIIRPITLSIRLSANIVAGHLLMSLLSSFSINRMSHSIIASTPITLLIILEIGVALVQAYVLITLMLLYQNETA